MPDEPRARPDERLPRAVVLGCAGERLTAEERGFFAAADPFGFVLFRRNCRARDQLRALVDELRASVGRPDAPVLVDQEGGRVARLQPPEWRRNNLAIEKDSCPTHQCPRDPAVQGSSNVWAVPMAIVQVVGVKRGAVSQIDQREIGVGANR